MKPPAEAVRQGFAAAAKIQADGPAWRVYATTAEVEDVLAAYEQAVAAGARVVVGPLTRNAVTALASRDRLDVPTLTLSLPDREIPVAPPLLYLFGLAVEEDARQVADLAWREGRRRALVIAAEAPLAQRMQAAFVARWQALGGVLSAQLRFAPGREASLKALAANPEADMIFLAANAAEARSARPYLPPTLTVYATAQVLAGKLQDPRHVELSGVRFVDMPWLLQPDHPAVMVYPRPEPPLNVELERLYALGIDAQRLAALLWRDAIGPGFALDGVTGQLTLGTDHVFRREGVPAEFQQDTVVLVEEAPR